MTNSHFHNIYTHHADDYQAMIQYHDVDGNLLTALQGIRSLEGLEVVDFGAGTGRVSFLLAPHVKRIQAFDQSPAMIEVAEKLRAERKIDHIHFRVAPNKAVPAEDNCADIAIQGWSFAHVRDWYPDTWQVEAAAMLAEMERVIRSGGTLIHLETQGTGYETPRPPTPNLGEYYQWLEGQGYHFKWIRMDYAFPSLEEAVRLMTFFFGEEMGKSVRENNWQTVPECAGIWWREN